MPFILVLRMMLDSACQKDFCASGVSIFSESDSCLCKSIIGSAGLERDNGHIIESVVRNTDLELGGKERVCFLRSEADSEHNGGNAMLVTCLVAIGETSDEIISF